MGVQMHGRTELGGTTSAREAADHVDSQTQRDYDAAPLALNQSAATIGASDAAVQRLDTSLVQFRRAARSHADPADVHAAASRGTSGGGSTLPHLDRIQASFGDHDVSGIAAHVGGPASEACETMGAAAYASGDSVAFKTSPSLHTAAHEAAHVVQQRRGVSLDGGVGQVGDRYEQHADAVADLVVQGKSAEGLINQMAGAGGRSGRGVQKKDEGPPPDYQGHDPDRVGETRPDSERSEEDLRDQKLDRLHQTWSDALQLLPNQDIIYEQLAHRYAYENYVTPDEARHLETWGYQGPFMGSVGWGGFGMMPFPIANRTKGEPPNEAERAAYEKIHQATLHPVLGLRGTDDIPDGMTDAEADGVGTYQFNQCSGMIKQALAALSSGGKVDVVGHSLGGALAQMTAAKFPSFVNRVVTFQSPGISEETVKGLSARNDQMEATGREDEVVESTHYRIYGDVVSASGERWTEGKVRTVDIERNAADWEEESRVKMQEKMTLAELAEWKVKAHTSTMLEHIKDTEGEDRVDMGPHQTPTWSPERIRGYTEQSTSDPDTRSPATEVGRKIVGGALVGPYMPIYNAQFEDIEGRLSGWMITASKAAEEAEAMRPGHHAAAALENLRNLYPELFAADAVVARIDGGARGLDRVRIRQLVADELGRDLRSDEATNVDLYLSKFSTAYMQAAERSEGAGGDESPAPSGDPASSSPDSGDASGDVAE